MLDNVSSHFAKKMDKASTRLEKSGKTSEIGYSFSNARSLIPLHFSSKDEELRAKKLLSTFLSPAIKEQHEDYTSHGKLHELLC